MEWKVAEAGEDGLSEVLLSGDCDLYSAPAFARDMMPRIAAGGLRLDFSEVGYLDSTGVGAIIRLVQEARRIGRELRFRGLGGTPRRVLGMANILPLLKEERE